MQVLPKVSVRYQCSPGTFTYVSVAKGYKTGGYNVQMFGDLVQEYARYDLMSKFMPSEAKKPAEVEEVAAYKPEHSWNYEMGIRSELIEDRLHAELTLFYMDIQDIQLTTLQGEAAYDHQWRQGRQLWGGGKLRSRIAEGLTADLNYGFTRATFRDYKTLDKNETEINYKDNFIPYTPRHTVSLGLNYTKLLRNSWFDQFTVSVQYAGAGKIFWTEKNDISQDFYGVLNGKVGVRKGIVNLNVWSRNMTDTDYQAFYFESFDNSFIQKGKPFQIGAEVAVTF